MRPKVKICCIKSVEEAENAIKFGASAIGLVGRMPSGPGVISLELIGEIARNIPPPISTFLLTSATTAKLIIEEHRRTNTTTFQLVDDVHEHEFEQLRTALPQVQLVQVIHVNGYESLDKAMRIASYVDAILLDSGNPNLPVKELGGTGRIHDWEVSREINEKINLPMFLAGGLNKDNVIQAIQTVRPFGIDLCSSVRISGKLDPYKLEEFFTVLNQFYSP